MKKKLLKKQLKQVGAKKRYTIEFAKNVNFEALNQDPVLSKNLEWLTFRNSSGQAYIKPNLSEKQLSERLSQVLELSPDEIKIQEAKDSWSEFHPLG